MRSLFIVKVILVFVHEIVKCIIAPCTLTNTIAFMFYLAIAPRTVFTNFFTKYIFVFLSAHSIIFLQFASCLA